MKLKSFSIYKFEIVQFQANILDQNILKNTYVKFLKEKKGRNTYKVNFLPRASLM